LVRYVGVGEHTLMAAALGTGAGTLVAMVAIGYTVHARFGAFIPTLTALRSIVAGVVAFCVSRALLGSSAWRTLLALAAGALAYACMLLIMRELTREDLAQVTRLARRKRS
jgi:hypothetical protein